MVYASVNDDVRWGMLHAAAGAACAPGGFQSDVFGFVVPKPVNVTCATACQNNTPNGPMTCRQAMGIAIGGHRRATSYVTGMAAYAFYSCTDATASGIDELTANGPNALIPFCCCYK